MLAHGKCDLRRSAHLRDCHAETVLDKGGLAIWETDNGQLRDYEIYGANAADPSRPPIILLLSSAALLACLR
jgi:hypothetical protein